MKKKEKKSGFMLIETLTVVFILAVIVTTFYATFTTGTRVILDAKNRLGANSLANEKMEIVRNLKYDDVGILGGIPNGSISENENVIENGKPYQVETFVEFEDDPLDGIYPTDTISNDYKLVKITVSWNGGLNGIGNVYLISRFVPHGLESNSGGGVLAINIVDGTGAGVSQANVHIINSTVSPSVNFSADTSDAGNLMFPGALQSTQEYQLIVSKSGYETIATLSPYPTTIDYYPTDVHASVISGALNMATIVINKVSNLNIITADGAGNALSGVVCDFEITGGRIIGTTPDMSHAPVYSIQNQSSSVPVSGEKVFNIISSGQYTIIPVVPSGYVLAGTEPLVPFSLQPDTTLEVKIKLASQTVSALFLTVVEDGTSNLVVGAQVELKNSSGYDVTQITGVDGKTFFLNGTDPLASGTYDLKITATGYQENISQIEINSNELNVASVNMLL